MGMRKGNNLRKVQLLVGVDRGIGDLGVMKFVTTTTMDKRARTGERIATTGVGDG
jgi:hypothetical protein